VRQGPRELAGLVRECVNCGSPLDGPGAVARGPDTAWHLHCQACFHLVADELELVMDRANGAPIMIYRCRGCGSARSCRPAWTTRCHVGLDERSIGPVVRAAADAFGERLAGDEALERQARMLAREGPDVDESRALVEAVSSLTLAAATAALSARDGRSWQLTCAVFPGPASRHDLARAAHPSPRVARLPIWARARDGAAVPASMNIRRRTGRPRSLDRVGHAAKGPGMSYSLK